MTREEEVAYAARLRQAPDAKDRLMVGHTRNIPRILDALGVPDGGTVKLNPDTDYDNLFVVQMYPDRPARMVRVRYPIAPADRRGWDGRRLCRGRGRSEGSRVGKNRGNRVRN